MADGERGSRLRVITISVSVTETRCGFAGSKDGYHTHNVHSFFADKHRDRRCHHLFDMRIVYKLLLNCAVSSTLQCLLS